LIVVAVDPAARCAYYAIFENDTLQSVGISKPKPRDNLPYSAHWVFERPRKYTRFAAAHKDLDRLLKMNATFQRRVRKAGGIITEVYPQDWKGNVPKEIHHRRIQSVLSAEEAALVAGPGDSEYDHNLYDAVALGLWHLGRTLRGGTR
jgi:hypothetical protein